MKQQPSVLDQIVVRWPGTDDMLELTIEHVGPAADGILCAFFRHEGVIGCEAIEDLVYVHDVWTLREDAEDVKNHKVAIHKHDPIWIKKARIREERGDTRPEHRLFQAAARPSDLGKSRNGLWREKWT